MGFPLQNSLVVAPVRKEIYSWDESFSHVPQEFSWLVVQNDMRHLTPSKPVRWRSPWWSCSFDIWTDFSMLLSLQVPPSCPLFCLSFGSGFISVIVSSWGWIKSEPALSKRLTQSLPVIPFGLSHCMTPWRSHAANHRILSEIVPPPCSPHVEQHHQHPSGTKPSYLLFLCLPSHLVCSCVVSENQGGSTQGITADQQDTSNLAMEELEDHFCSSYLGDQQGQVTDFVLMLYLL